MTDHLPECPTMDWPPYIYENDRPICICDRLRACEQRIMSLNPVALGVRIAKRSRERALDAAREAVAALEVPSDWVGSTRQGLDNALDAIDALRGEL